MDWLMLFARHPVIPSLWHDQEIEKLPPQAAVVLISRASYEGIRENAANTESKKKFDPNGTGIRR